MGSEYVVSSTLEKADWTGSHILRGDVETEVRKLKEHPGRDFLLAGSGQLFNALMKANLIDLYRFMVHPIVLGTGPKPFAEGAARRELVLATSRSLPRGIVILEYRPAA